jgi:hypothetical protein
MRLQQWMQVCGSSNGHLALTRRLASTCVLGLEVQQAWLNDGNTLVMNDDPSLANLVIQSDVRRE